MGKGRPDPTAGSDQCSPARPTHQAPGRYSQVSRIAIENLERTYPGTTQPAVGGVTLTVEPGEVFGLLGPNGAGK
jgi:ABC-type multidrug transport system fused ATPase/permease subunit